MQAAALLMLGWMTVEESDLSVLVRVVLMGLGGVCTLAQASDPYETCLLKAMASADDAQTVKAIRAQCASEKVPSVAASVPAEDVSDRPPTFAPAPAPAIISERITKEEKHDSDYVITAHRPNYLLLASMNERRPDAAPFARDSESAKAQKVEAKYQISMKAPVISGLLDGEDALYAAYTQRSIWQVYNRVASAPFRETNYEPELWYQHGMNTTVMGWRINGYMLGVNHQSNGRGKDFSRSWNRVFAAAAMERGSLGMMLRSWVRMKEDPNNDDNPDITHYLGNFDLTMVGKAWGQSWDLMVRNNLRRHTNRGAVQLGWSFPLTSRFRGYMQWFRGYGETLIDYNHYQNAIGVGIMLTDW